jgi:aryl-alcohol dehydrogenase-like predicted oxidoreductase
MRYRQLGNTGIFVSQFGLGTLNFGGADSPFWSTTGALDDHAADELIGLAVDAGVNLIDTADVYGEGQSEDIIGRVLGARRDQVLLATKGYARTGPGPNDVGSSRLSIRRAIDTSLRRLRTDRIDLYQLHNLDPLTGPEETLAALDVAVAQGKVLYVGASNLAAWELMRFLGAAERDKLARFVSMQSYYSLVGRDIEHEILPAVRAANLGLLVYAPLAGGLLSGTYDRNGTTTDVTRRKLLGDFEFPPVNRERAYDVIDVARAVAQRHGVSMARVALAWVLTRPGVTSVLLGARRAAQLTDNLAALDLTLTDQDVKELETVSALPTPYPDWTRIGDELARAPQR